MKIARILWLLDPTPASGAAPSWKSFHSGSAWMAYVIHFPPLWGANYWINTQLNAIFLTDKSESAPTVVLFRWR